MQEPPLSAGIHRMQLPPQKRQGVVAVPESCLDVHLPAQAPAGAAVPPAIQHGPHCRKQARIAVLADQMPREQPAQRRRMTMLGLGLLVFRVPLQQAAVMADAAGRGVGQHMAGGVLVRLMDAQVGQDRQVIPQHLADNLVRHGGRRRHGYPLAFQHIPVLRGGSRAQCLVPVFIRAHRVDEELGRLPQYGQRALRKERLISRVDVMLEQMPRQPAAGHGPPAVHRRALPVHPHRRGMAPQVGDVVHHRTPGVRQGICHLTAGHAQAVHEVAQRLCHTGQAADFRRPVVHFRVDAGGVVADPGGLQHVVPDALQVERPGAGAGAAHQQIPPELVQQDGQRIVLTALGIAAQTIVGGKVVVAFAIKGDGRARISDAKSMLSAARSSRASTA